MLISRSFRRPRRCIRDSNGRLSNECGVTMILVALCMVAVIAMAALSIDVVTLYLDREETQRGADAAALAAARVISLSGITGTGNTDVDTTQWQAVCGTAGTATQVAQQVGAQNAVGGASATVAVTYSAQGATGGNSDCSGLGQAFAINPTVIVQVTRTGLPTLFSRIWSRNPNTVSATAAAEVFNPSDSGRVASGGQEIPVVPRCVKPLIIPDEDPVQGTRFLRSRNGRIMKPGINTIDNGVIGESFNLLNDCTGPSCPTYNPPKAVTTPSVGVYYIAGAITPPAVAVAPSCNNDDFQNAIAGCDETVYQCGTVNGANANLTTNPGADVSAAAQCLTNIPTGQDTLITTNGYPYQIQAGSGNPIVPANQLITSSNSIMTIPIYDDDNGGTTPQPLTGTNPTITIIGFLQVFVNSVPDNKGTLNVTVLNVAGCGDSASTTMSAPGSSPVPIRLITLQ